MPLEHEDLNRASYFIKFEADLSQKKNVCNINQSPIPQATSHI